MRPFEPIGAKGKKDLCLEGFDAITPAPEPGTIITHEHISEWLGEPFPFPRQSSNGMFVYGDTKPWDDARRDLLARGVAFVVIPNVGYKVANAAETVMLGENNGLKAKRQLNKQIMHARAVTRTEADPATRRRAEEMERDAREQLREVSRLARQRAIHANRWEPPGDE